MVWRILKYIEHLFYRRHRQGRRIHSPYLFDFVHHVIFNASKGEVPVKIQKLHRELRNDLNLIPAGTLGEQSSADQSENRTVRSFVRVSSVSRKQGALLYRISQWIKPEIIIELGTGLGVSAMYLASGAPLCPMHTIEGNPDRADFAVRVIKRCGLEGVKVHYGDLDQKLNDIIPDIKGRFVAFVDANHRYDPTISYVRRLITTVGEEAVIIMDDIYWSRGMNLAWQEVISWPEVRVSIDLYHMGILLLRKDLHKVHVKIKF